MSEPEHASVDEPRTQQAHRQRPPLNQRTIVHKDGEPPAVTVSYDWKMQGVGLHPVIAVAPVLSPGEESGGRFEGGSG